MRKVMMVAAMFALAGILLLGWLVAVLQESAAQDEKGKGKSRFGGGAPGFPGERGVMARTVPQWEYAYHTRGEIQQLGNDNFLAGLNKLGDAGWELVATDPGSTPGQATKFCFKRQKGEVMPGGGPPARTRGEANLFGGDSSVPREPVAEKRVTQVVALKHAKAAVLVAILQEIYAREKLVQLVSDERTNKIIFVGPEDRLNEVRALLIELDEPGKETELPPAK